MIHGDMSVTEFVTTVWKNKIKVALIVVALIFAPRVYDEWQTQRAAKQLEADRQAVDTEASIAGMMLASAWKSCREIGIVNDMDRCAEYKGRLIQEIAAPSIAKVAIEHRDSYYQSCQRFHAAEYCSELLARSFHLSVAQQNNKNE